MNKIRMMTLFLAITIGGLILIFMIKKSQTTHFNSTNNSQNTTVKDYGKQNDSSENERVVLFLGIDQNKPSDSIKDQTRTDTIMLVKANFKTQELLIISIPRDTRIMIDGVPHKINAAHVYGGVPLVTKEIEKLFHTKVDSYVKFSFDSVLQIVDQIGGVEGTLNENLANELKKPVGKNRLNGKEALQLLRHRKSYATGDYERIQAQQQFVFSFIKETMKKENKNELIKLYQDSKTSIDTNIKAEEQIDWIYLLKNMNPNNIQWKILKGDARYIDGISYWIYDKAYVDQLNREYFQDRNELKKHYE